MPKYGKEYPSSNDARQSYLGIFPITQLVSAQCGGWALDATAGQVPVTGPHHSQEIGLQQTVTHAKRWDEMQFKNLRL